MCRAARALDAAQASGAGLQRLLTVAEMCSVETRLMSVSVEWLQHLLTQFQSTRQSVIW